MQNHLTAVSLGALAAHELPFFKPVHELHNSVMAQLHALGDFPNAGFHPGGQSTQRQHEHILLRLKVGVSRSFLAAVQEYTYLVSKFRKRAEFRSRHRSTGHTHIVSLPDII